MAVLLPGKCLCWEEGSVPVVIITSPVGLSLCHQRQFWEKERKGICPPGAEDVGKLGTFEAMGWSFTLGKTLPLLLARIYWCVHTFPPVGAAIPSKSKSRFK